VQAIAEALKLDQTFPRWPTLGDGVRTLFPRRKVGGELIFLRMNLEQLGVAAKHLQGAHVLRLRRGRPRRVASSGFCKGE